MNTAQEVTLTGWVTKELYCRNKGLTEGQIRGKIQRRVWQAGVHYAVRDGGTWLHVENIEEWLTNGNTQQASVPAAREALKSGGSSRVRPIRNTFQKAPQRLV